MLCGSMGVQVFKWLVLWCSLSWLFVCCCEFGGQYAVMLFELCSSYGVGLGVVWFGVLWLVLLCFCLCSFAAKHHEDNYVVFRCGLGSS